MANYIIQDTELIAIADAIRTKNGSADTYTTAEMADAIEAIESGGGGGAEVELLEVTANGTYTAPEGVGYSPVVVNVPQDGAPPAEAFMITGDCNYKFYGSGWNWFLDMYGNQITTNNLSDCSYMFYYNSAIDEIPFDFNLKSGNVSCSNMFAYASNLKKLPKIKGAPSSFYYFVYHAVKLREITEEDVADIDLSGLHNGTYKQINYTFTDCYSLRSIAPSFISKLYTKGTSASYQITGNGFNSCYSLDEIKRHPVPCSNTTSVLLYNIFSSEFHNCYRLKNMIFDMQEDGTPFVWKAKGQTIELYGQVGWAQNTAMARNNITGLNSGITADKEVKDDATYQALKDDPDWFTCDINYSRYNHDSAVATINSLPDTSAYLAEKGGTNTIKFKGAAGALTDGGAINTLTEEEIAVAAAKGWTVTFV